MFKRMTSFISHDKPSRHARTAAAEQEPEDRPSELETRLALTEQAQRLLQERVKTLEGEVRELQGMLRGERPAAGLRERTRPSIRFARSSSGQGTVEETDELSPAHLRPTSPPPQYPLPRIPSSTVSRRSAANRRSESALSLTQGRNWVSTSTSAAAPAVDIPMSPRPLPPRPLSIRRPRSMTPADYERVCPCSLNGNVCHPRSNPCRLQHICMDFNEGACRNTNCSKAHLLISCAHSCRGQCGSASCSHGHDNVEARRVAYARQAEHLLTGM
ncbi:MAG: hypothetical protein M1825_005683 [Sarcosagium campestre]|nr:MAG: hypothetical protein M1825_005683 [Sarcosagium campestre]